MGGCTSAFLLLVPLENLPVQHRSECRGNGILVAGCAWDASVHPGPLSTRHPPRFGLVPRIFPAENFTRIGPSSVSPPIEPRPLRCLNDTHGPAPRSPR